MTDKGWHIKKKFLAKVKIHYTPVDFPTDKMMTFEIPSGYQIVLKDLSGKETTWNGPSAVKIDPSLFYQDSKITVDVLKQAPVSSYHDGDGDNPGNNTEINADAGAQS